MLPVEELQGFIDADPVTVTHAISYSVQDVRTTLADPCPAADVQDEFDADGRQAIAESAPLEIPLDLVQFTLEQLPDSAAAGASGWTYAAIKAISLSNGRNNRHMQAAEPDAGRQASFALLAEQSVGFYSKERRQSASPWHWGRVVSDHGPGCLGHHQQARWIRSGSSSTGSWLSAWMRDCGENKPARNKCRLDRPII